MCECVSEYARASLNVNVCVCVSEQVRRPRAHEGESGYARANVHVSVIDSGYLHSCYQ